MYSYAGPLIVAPLFVATGSDVCGPSLPPMRVLKFAPLVPADRSHPLHTIV